jgi:hypothetical protein
MSRWISSILPFPIARRSFGSVTAEFKTKVLMDVALRVDGIHLCRLQERRDGSPRLGATVASGE